MLFIPALDPSVLPDGIELSVEETSDSEETLDLLESECCNVRILQRGFEEARTSANKAFAVPEETLAEMRIEVEKIWELQQGLQVLNEENATLLARTMELSEDVFFFESVRYQLWIL